MAFSLACPQALSNTFQRTNTPFCRGAECSPISLRNTAAPCLHLARWGAIDQPRDSVVQDGSSCAGVAQSWPGLFFFTVRTQTDLISNCRTLLMLLLLFLFLIFFMNSVVRYYKGHIGISQVKGGKRESICQAQGCRGAVKIPHKFQELRKKWAVKLFLNFYVAQDTICS